MAELTTEQIVHHFAQQAQIMLVQAQRQAGYLARQEIDGLLAPLRRDATRLEPFGFKVYSQNDEDGILQEIFRRLGIDDHQAHFAEIGVENGLECNSLYLLHKGWRGLWLEGNAAQQAPIQQKFAALLQNQRLKLGIGLVQPDNINNTLQQAGVADNLDLLSIDIDGNDIYLLEALSVQPKVICIAYNAKFPAALDKQPVFNPQHAWRGTDYSGSSLKAITRVANNKGYALVGTNITGCNAFYVRNDLINSQFGMDRRVEHLYNPPRYWLTFDHFARIGHMADFGPYVDLLEA